MRIKDIYLAVALILLSAGRMTAFAVSWSVETIDSGLIVSAPDMVLDSSGNPHISYFDGTNEDLKYATRLGQVWSTSTVTSSGRTGSRPSIALDPAGHPHIVFEYITMTGISYAAFSGSSWTVMGLDWLNLVGDDSSIAVDSSGRPHFAYYYETDGDLRYLTLDGVSWSSSTVDSAGNVGYFVSMALDSSQNPHVAYNDFTNGKLKYAKWDGASWSIEVVDSNGNTGWEISLVLDADDKPHISYGEYTLSYVRYAKKIGGTWEIETVAKTDLYNHGTYSSLALDSKGTPHIVLRSSVTEGMQYSRKTGEGWEFYTFPTSVDTRIVTLDEYDVPHFTASNNQNLYYILPTPVAPAEISLLERSPTSLKWGWTDASDGFSGYRVHDSSDDSLLSGGLIAGTTYWEETGLSANTAYGRKVAAFASDLVATSSALSVYTMAAPPADSYVSQASSYSVTLVWSANSNPGNTIYEISRSTDDFSTSFSTPVPYGSSFAGTNYSDSGLSPETTYFYRIRAYNGDTVPTAFDSVVSTVTRPAMPAAAVISAGSIGVSSTAINWSWNIQTPPSVTGLRVISSTGGALSGDLPVSATFYVQAGLSPDASSQVMIEVFNITGVSTSAAVARYALANPPVGAAVAEVGITSVSVCWGNNSNPAYTAYDLGVWGADSSTVTMRVSTCCIDVTGLYSGTTYFFSVAEVNGDGVGGQGTPAISTVTRQVPYLGSIPPEAPVTVSYQSVHGEVSVGISPWTFGETIQLAASAPGAYPPDTSLMGELRGSGAGVEITLDKPLQPSNKVQLTVSYRDADVAGMDENKLLLARYDTIGGVWVPLISYPDPDNNKVMALVDHFSTFQIMQATPSSSVKEVKVSPNPLRPAKGHTAMTFSNLPASAVLRIYTLTGDLIREMSADASGITSWDGRNRSGVYVASGVYFVFAEKSGVKTTFKVAVQR